MRISAAGLTDIGRKRDHNEDSYGLFQETGLYMVADGMGGHAAGELASRIAVDTVSGFVGASSGRDDITFPFGYDRGMGRAANRLVNAVKLANGAVISRASGSPELKGMGTTVVAALVDEGQLYVAHVGDSRAYRFSGGSLSRITTDHSFVEEQVRLGMIAPDKARSHPMRNIITRALGVRQEVAIDVSEHVLAPGDMYLLCTDGLTGMVDDREIERVINAMGDDLQECVDILIAVANNNGGNDNITAVLIRAE